MSLPLTPESCRIYPDNWLEPLPLLSYFERDRPLEVDVGCGKGRFLLARAAACPDINYLGIDRMLRRIRKVDRKTVRRGLRNIRVLRIEAYYCISYLLPPESVSAYYIFFPDPWPKKRHHMHRLFDVPFMNALARTMRPNATLHFATDHLQYFEDVHKLLRADSRFKETHPFEPCDQERTDFELLFLHKTPIGRCSFINSRSI
jgi:tRNA (guanine-N7-)-methyltransferase